MNNIDEFTWLDLVGEYTLLAKDDSDACALVAMETAATNKYSVINVDLPASDTKSHL